MPWETPQTVETWLGREREGLTALARSLVRNQADAEDCVQDAYVAALRDPPTSNPGAWLRTVVRRGAHRTGRDASRRWRREERAARPEGAPVAGDAAEQIEIRLRVLAAVRSLEEPYRTTVVLRYFEGHLPAKIASLQGIPVKTVKTRLSRALSQLRSDLDRAYGGRRSAWLPLMAAIGGVGRAAILLLLKKVATFGFLLLFAGGLAWWAIDSFESERMAPPVETATRPGAPMLQGFPSKPPLVASAASVLHEEDPVPTQTFAGRVVDPDGRGVAGARVDVFWSGVRPSSQEPKDIHLLLRREAERRERPSGLTDAEGYFRSDRPYGSSSYLRVEAPGFVRQVVGPHASGSFVLVRLGTSGGTRVRILSEAGVPVPDAEVRLAATSGTRPWTTYQVLDSARSDAAGRVELPVFTGTLHVQVIPNEPEQGTVERGLTSSEAEVEIRVPAMKWMVTKRILDAETGAPVAGAWVDLVHGTTSPDEGPQCRRILADADGFVRFPWQEGFEPVVDAPGYELLSYASPGDWGGDTVSLARAMRVEGVVLDESGAPFEGAAILATSAGDGPRTHQYFDGAREGRPPFVAWSDAHGRFAFEVALPYGRTKERPDDGLLMVLALHPAHAAAVVDGIRIVPGRREELTLRLPRPATLVIEIVDADGTPVVGHSVGVGRKMSGNATWSAMGLGVSTVAYVRPRRLETDAAGRVLADGLPPGPHLVRSDFRHVEVEVREGETQPVRIVRGAGPGIGGRVLDSKGAPRAGVEVGIYVMGPAYARTDADGRFRFTDLPDGEYRFSVRVGDEYISTPVRARPGAEVTLRAPSAPTRLRIHVEGPPAGAARYSLCTASGQMEPPRTARGSAFSLLPTNPFDTAPLSPGTGVLVVEAPGFGWTAVRFDAAEDVTTDVVVRLRPSGNVVVRVPDRVLAVADRSAVRLTPTDGYLESVMGMSLADLRKPATDATHLASAIHRTRGNGDYLEWQASDGAFRFSDVTSGPYEASLGHYEVGSDGSASWVSLRSMRIEVRSGETTNVDL